MHGRRDGNKIYAQLLLLHPPPAKGTHSVIQYIHVVATTRLVLTFVIECSASHLVFPVVPALSLGAGRLPGPVGLDGALWQLPVEGGRGGGEEDVRKKRERGEMSEKTRKGG